MVAFVRKELIELHYYRSSQINLQITLHLKLNCFSTVKMAALIVQSRFAGLKIEDDDNSPSESIPKINKIKTNNAKKTEPVKKTKINNSTKVQTTTRRKKAKQVQMSAEQWEMWKQKDEELVDGSYEDELHQAILLSKLDYEEKKDVYKQSKKDAYKEKIQEEQAAKNKNKKQKKKNVMSLDQFNDMMNGEETKSNHEIEKDSIEDTKSPGRDTEFFERVKDDTKNELLKDKNNDRVRNRQLASDEVLTRVQFLDALERKDKEISSLKLEVSGLKQELLTVKSRNKKLCNILGQGEMKDKAQVLVEVERLRAVQAELNAELASLHTDLEKERSKNPDPRARDKKSASKKKNIRFDVSSEAILSKESSSGTAG